MTLACFMAFAIGYLLKKYPYPSLEESLARNAARRGDEEKTPTDDLTNK